MKLINSTNLPEVIVNAIENMVYAPLKKGLRITTLISPPIIHQLKLRHWDELKEDVVDNTWRLLGKAIHGVIERSSDSAVVEQRMEREIDGVKITGTADVINGSELYDYKITSVWHKVFSDGLPPEWVKQLNCYAYLFGEIKSAKIIVIYRDWSKSRAGDTDYPPAPLMAYDVQLANEADQLAYIKDRIKLHQEAGTLPDDELPICSPEDRWATATTWAVYKNTNKTATRVFNSREEAEKIMAVMEGQSKDKFRIEERPGTDKRCAFYCQVAPYCTYYKQNILNKKKVDTDK